MITMKEIGKLCHIAEATVSKALKGDPKISPKTRELVQRVAKEHGYQPNAMVKFIQSGCSRSIGIACNHFRCPFAGALLDGAQQELFQAGYDSYIVSWDRIVEDQQDFLARFGRRRVDGLLLLPAANIPSPEYCGQLSRFSSPIVAVDQTWDGLSLDIVQSDDFNASYELTKKLCRKGYRNIGMITCRNVSTGRDRAAGIGKALTELGLSPDPAFCLDIPHAGDYGYQRIRKMLSKKKHPDLLICFNDEMAVAACNASVDTGLAIPEDIAVTGFGDLPVASTLRPALTTVSQNCMELGRLGAKMLLDRIANRLPKEPQKVIVPAKIIWRDTTK